MKDLSQKEIVVINVGVSSFIQSITTLGGMAIHVDWSPPSTGDPTLAKKLAYLIGNPTIENANREAFDRYLSAQPFLEGVGMAQETIPEMGERTILHAGPAVTWEQMPGPMKGAFFGGIIYERWADILNAAEKLAASGDIQLSPCHHHSSVGPLSGIITPSMPVWIVRNTKHGNRAYSNMSEGLGKVLRFGANTPEVIRRLE